MVRRSAAAADDVHVARLAPFLVCDILEALQLRALTEAMCAMFDRRVVWGCFFLGECLAGGEVTGAGLVTGALATGVGAGVGETGVVVGGAVETGVVVVVGGVLAGGVLVGGVLAGGVGSEVVVPEPLHRAAAQHGSTTRNLLSGISGPSMIHRFSGE